MAVRQTQNLPGQLKFTDRIPKTRCVAQCITEEFKTSKNSGNPMIVREWEVRVPETVEVNGVNKILGGQKVTQYLTTISFKEVDGKQVRDDAKSDRALARLRDENSVLGLPSDSIDDENPELLAKGIYADITVGPEEYDITEPPTPEEVALGKKVGKAKIGADGKPEKGYRVKLVGVLGRATGY